MRRLRAQIPVFFLLCLLAAIANAQNQTLQLGTPIERQLSAGEAHTFTVSLEENTLLQLVVEQRGIDVIVKVASPEGKSLGDFDSPNGTDGPENVSFVAVTAGVYRVTVAPLNQEVPTGRYVIKIVEQRQATEEELKNSKNQEANKAKGLALLADIEDIIAEIRLPQTRIRAQFQAAQLLWDSDEKRATKYMNDAIVGIKEFIATIDAGSQNYARYYGAISQLRYEIAEMLARRDPDAALSFIHSTKLPPNPYGNQREQALQDAGLELEIGNNLIAKDPQRALKVARQSLKTGYSPNLVSTVSALRQKDAEVAAQLANEIVGKLRKEQLLNHQEAAQLTINFLQLCRTSPRRIQINYGSGAIVRMGSGWEEASESFLPEGVCRELFQKAFDEAQSYQQANNNVYSPQRNAAWSLYSGLQGYGPDLDRIIPGAAATIEKKLAEMNEAANQQGSYAPYQNTINTGSTETALEAIQKAPQELRDQLYAQLANRLAGSGDTARAKQILNDNITNPFQRRQQIANIEQQELYQAMAKGKVDEALKAISALKTPRERANMLMQVARQIGPGLKRSAAINLLEQARGLLGPSAQAQDQDQMNALLELARAFSRYDTKRAFEIVDPLVDQLNDICAAARTLEGFGVEFYEDEELDLQNGSSVANLAIQMSGALGTLATTNFDRAKQASDRFRLPEVRLRAYLEIAQQTIQGVR